MSDTDQTHVHDLDELDDPLAGRLAGAAGATPSWRPFTAEAMQSVHRRARRRQATERILSVACALFAVALAATTLAAIGSGGDDDARTLRTADNPSDPSEPTHGEDDPLVDPNTTSTTRPSYSYDDGRDPLPHARAEVTGSNPVATIPPHATPTTGPTPSTTAPPMVESRPPTAFAALNGVEIEALRGPSCWDRGGSTACEEKDQFWYEDAPLLDGIQSGSSMWLRWAVHEQPAAVTVTSYFASVNAGPETHECVGGNPCRIDFGYVSFGTDPTWFVIETHWKHGTVTHAVKVRSHPVEADA